MNLPEYDFNASILADHAIAQILEHRKEPNLHFDLVDLLKGIFSKVHPLFAIDCSALSLYNKEKTHIIRAYHSQIIDGEAACMEYISDPVQLSPVNSEIAAFNFPILKSREDWIEGFGQNHSPANSPIDYRFHCYLPLEYAGRILGTFELHNHYRELSAEGLTFCCTIADLIAGLIGVNEIKPAHPYPFETNTTQRADPSELTVFNHERIKELETEIKKLKEKLAEFQRSEPGLSVEVDQYQGIIGSSVEMQAVFGLLRCISVTETTVLISGETGTGKELIAKSIHQGSHRNKRQMVNVNCAAIPPNLIESELFGHEKGSFTGATERRIGKFELAHQSTIFLDEVGELPLELQVKLLRVLQEKEIERVGGKASIPVDVRIVSATNRDLLAEVKAGRFRQDLFYRLHVFPVSLPALRNRKSDIAALANFFLQKFAGHAKGNQLGFSKKAISTMKGYHWPGNVRELANFVERQAVMARGSLIKNVELPSHAEEGQSLIAPVKTISQNERDHIFSVLELCNGKISGRHGAAKLLGVPATTLNSKIKKLGLQKKHVF